MLQIITIFHVLFAAALIVLILLQQGKGATMGAGFGAGASQTVFGSQGASSFMLKITAFFALLFFVTSLALGHFAAPAPSSDKSNMLNSVEQISQQQNQERQAAQQAIGSLSPTLPTPAVPK